MEFHTDRYISIYSTFFAQNKMKIQLEASLHGIEKKGQCASNKQLYRKMCVCRTMNDSSITNACGGYKWQIYTHIFVVRITDIDTDGTTIAKTLNNPFIQLHKHKSNCPQAFIEIKMFAFRSIVFLLFYVVSMLQLSLSATCPQ